MQIQGERFLRVHAEQCFFCFFIAGSKDGKEQIADWLADRFGRQWLAGRMLAAGGC